jgi:uncharacterized protein
VALVRSSPQLMAWLVAARDCCRTDPPIPWAIGAGAVRNLVWDRLTGRRNPPADVDLAYFDGSGRLDAASLEACLRERAPEVAWDVKDQALVHNWYERVFGFPVEPLVSLEDAVSTWPENCTCVAVHLRRDGSVGVIAPYGLEDLFGLVLRRNPRRVTEEIFRERLRSKRIVERWPEVRVVDGSAQEESLA